MSERPVADRQTPLGGAVLDPRPGLRIAECGPLGQITLRAAALSGDGTDAVRELVGAISGAGCPAPLSAVFSGDERGAVWMAPDEVLLMVPRGEVGPALARIADALSGTHHLALDVSDARAVIRLDGPDAAETIAKGAPVDVSEAAFPVGRARRTQLGGLAAGIWRRGPEHWEVVCFRSYAHHLLAWLERSGLDGAEVGRFSH